MDTQLLHVVESLIAVRSQSTVEFPVAPVTVLHADMLVSAGSIKKFLWDRKDMVSFYE